MDHDQIADLRKLLIHNPNTGSLIWRRRDGGGQGISNFNTQFAGKEAGYRHHDCGMKLNVANRVYMAHTVMWALCSDEPPSGHVKHRDGDRFNNRIANLYLIRDCSEHYASPTRRHVTRHRRAIHVSMSATGEVWQSSYETNPLILASLTADEWEGLLKRVWRAPVPRQIVRLQAISHNASTSVHERRRALAVALFRQGMRNKDIATRLEITRSTVSRLLRGERS